MIAIANDDLLGRHVETAYSVLSRVQHAVTSHATLPPHYQYASHPHYLHHSTRTALAISRPHGACRARYTRDMAKSVSREGRCGVHTDGACGARRSGEMWGLRETSLC